MSNVARFTALPRTANLGLSKRTFRSALLAIAALCAAGSTDARAGEEEELRALVERSRAEAGVIKTARIKCFHFLIQSNSSLADGEGAHEVELRTSLTSAEFRALFEKKFLPQVGAPDAYVAMQREMTAHLEGIGKVNGEDLDICWSELRIVQDGEFVKNDEQFLGTRSIRKSTPRRFTTFDSYSKMADINDAGSRGDAYAADGLRNVLEQLPDEAFKLMKREALSGGREWRLVVPGGEAVIDVKSGWATHATAYDEASGVVVGEVWQAAPQSFPGGILFPAIYADATYENDADGRPKLAHADVFVLDAAEFNQRIEPAELLVAVPKGTEINDASEPERSGFKRRVVAEQDLTDVESVVFPRIKHFVGAVGLPKSLNVPKN